MSQPQHLIALEKANRTRLARAQSKREIYRGRLSLAGAMEMEHMQSMPVFGLLHAQKRWGRTRTLKILNLLVISESRRVESLTARQKQALLQACGQSERSAA